MNLAVGTPATLQLDDLVCRHGRTVAVDGVDLRLRSGEHVALTGPNGAGKSTLLRAVLGLHRPVAGRILVDGRTASTAVEWAERRRRVAWVPQRPVTGRFPLLVRELLASGGQMDAAGEAAECLGIWAYADRPVHTLSGGQVQRAFLARALGALGGEAGLLLADEPTAALDFQGQALVADVLERLGATVLVASHDRAVAGRCHRVVEMAGGQVRDATVSDAAAGPGNAMGNAISEGTAGR